MKRPLAACLALALPLSGLAGFSDHFEGSELNPRWGPVSEGDQVEYEVRNSWLSVTRVFFWGHPLAFTNAQVAFIARPGGDRTWTPPLIDFELRAVVSWGPGRYQHLYIGAAAFFDRRAPWDAGAMFYRNVPGQEPAVGVFFRNGPLTYVPAPTPGFPHEFRLQRIGNVGKAWLNGKQIYEFAGTFNNAIAYASMGFRGLDGPLRVDLFEIGAPPR